MTTYDQVDIDELLEKDFEEMSDDELGLILIHISQMCMRAQYRRMKLAELREERRLKRPLTEQEREQLRRELIHTRYQPPETRKAGTDE